jgi:oligopeptidase B
MTINPTVSKSQAPLAKQQPKELSKHGHTRTDKYFWLNERENPEVVEYLTQENEFTAAVMAPTKSFEDALYEEIVARLKKTDISVPVRRDNYFYYSRFEEGGEYPLYCRKRESLDATEAVMLNGNELAEGFEYFAIGNFKISSDENLISYAIDTVGRRIYTIQFKDLSSGEILTDRLEEVTHTLGSDQADDRLVYQEDDETFWLSVSKSKSGDFIFIGSYQTISSEIRYIDANDPIGEVKIFLERKRTHEYDIAHHGEYFYVRTNDSATNFRLMRVGITNTARDQWEEVIAHRDDVLIEDFDLFDDYLVVDERKDGLTQLRIRHWQSGEEHYLDFGEAAYTAGMGSNLMMDSKTLRFIYSSLTTPESVYDYQMNSKERVLLKREEVLGDFSPENYVTERLYANAADGERVPISLVYRKGFKKDGSAPLLLYGYGSYGYSMEATFRSYRLSLIDRGFVFAIAHIRGGQEMGRKWYDTGKMLQKKNTFTDFISCGEHLVSEKYCASDKLFCMGGSAGGLLIGAVINMRPDLWAGAVASVPFVDVITTMLDESIPLTTGEYDEWGNPNVKEYYDYILSYSPYDNVEAKEYPNLLVMTGLHDSQVQYWEPAKWVAKLREYKTDNNLLLLHTNMDAGHGGASGRYKQYKETALEFTFLLRLARAIDA